MSPRIVPVLLLAPAITLATIGFLAPLAWLLGTSFVEVEASGALTGALTVRNYQAFLMDPFTWWIVAQTVWLGVLVTALTLIASYPIALFLVRIQPKWRGVLSVLLISPLLVSSVVRTFGWMIILGDQGLLNSALLTLGLIPDAIALTNNSTGVVIALTEILMPYMALALISGFGRIDPVCEEAAVTLGATPWQRFWRVTFPLSLPGVALGVLICFALAMSSFVTPQLLGGGRIFVLATEIYDSAMVSLNWPRAAVQSVFLLALLLMALAGMSKITRSIERM
ncbi:ABC transporter permease [Microvirga sp. VF16]|uniref:ABC transporter permease n=1 Tax=Microvirga sp. VF16 TaxID=2807101 RepID=UPI00193DDF22|nr:ABC transporter permease [Microvirga sp. VF16]QRM33057.1 ABC transporter permease [Microvirga sp. VF16]